MTPRNLGRLRYGGRALLYPVCKTLMRTPVRRYIAKQTAHHQKQTFAEEFVQLLKWHGIESDERYLWK